MKPADYFPYVFCPVMAFGIIFLLVQMIRSSLRNQTRPRSVSFVFISLFSAGLSVCLAIPICDWFETNLSIETILSVLIPVVLGLVALILGSQFFFNLNRGVEYRRPIKPGVPVRTCTQENETGIPIRGPSLDCPGQRAMQLH
jgi:hypothetical protein